MNPKKVRFAYDLTGQRFGKLIGVAFTGVRLHRKRVWEFKCDCGNTTKTPATYVARGITKSCGCLRKEICILKNTTHGQTGTPEYALWESAKRRATKNGVKFTIVPADISIPETCPLLGVKIKSSKKFFTTVSPSLDRLDSTLGYVKGNVWVISYRANAIKNNATLEELGMVYEGLKKRLAA